MRKPKSDATTTRQASKFEVTVLVFYFYKRPSFCNCVIEDAMHHFNLWNSSLFFVVVVVAYFWLICVSWYEHTSTCCIFGGLIVGTCVDVVSFLLFHCTQVRSSFSVDFIFLFSLNDSHILQGNGIVVTNQKYLLLNILQRRFHLRHDNGSCHYFCSCFPSWLSHSYLFWKYSNYGFF